MIATEVAVFFFSKTLLEKIGFFYLVIAAHIAYISRYSVYLKDNKIICF
jgi:hypothetical protein